MTASPKFATDRPAQLLLPHWAEKGVASADSATGRLEKGGALIKTELLGKVSQRVIYQLRVL